MSCKFYTSDCFKDYYRAINKVLGMPSSPQLGRKSLFSS
jgi:hypothetical protein